MYPIDPAVKGEIGERKNQVIAVVPVDDSILEVHFHKPFAPKGEQYSIGFCAARVTLRHLAI